VRVVFLCVCVCLLAVYDTGPVSTHGV
jgi:hypothetical protein